MKIVSIESHLPILKNYPEPICGNNEIIVKLKACGICGSDIGNIFEDSSKPTKKIGHEISGIISKVGKKIKNLQVGDEIIVNHHCSCQKCHFCLHGNETMCEKFVERIEPCGLAENFKVSNWIIKKGGILKIPKKMSFKEATLIEPLACCLRAWNKLEIQQNDSVMILGFGTIGIFHAIIANTRKMNRIIIEDDNYRRDFGINENLGDEFFSVKDTKTRDFERFDEKIDLCIIANPNLECLNIATKVLRKGGTILFFGEPRANSSIKIDLVELYSKEIRIITSYSAANNDFVKSMKFIENNRIELKKLITHEFSLENAKEAIKMAREGKNRIKVIVTSND